jgi:processive 1,2-diacylglycerol beta-glucosyltransferase
MSKGLPLVIVHPIPGQGARNADYLLEEGAALRGNTLPALADKIDRLLDDPSHRATLRANAAAWPGSTRPGTSSRRWG